MQRDSIQVCNCCENVTHNTLEFFNRLSVTIGLAKTLYCEQINFFSNLLDEQDLGVFHILATQYLLLKVFENVFH